MAAAVDLFAERGFLATTIRDITGACGVTAAAFYNHFDSKEALLYAIVSEANSNLDVQIDRVVTCEQAPPQRLWSLVATLVTFNLTSPKAARVANREYGFLSPPLRGEVIEHRRRVRSQFETALGEGKTQGLLQRPSGSLETRLLAISIINLSIDSSEWYRPVGPLSLSEVTDAHCRLAMRMAGWPPDNR